MNPLIGLRLAEEQLSFVAEEMACRSDDPSAAAVRDIERQVRELRERWTDAASRVRS